MKKTNNGKVTLVCNECFSRNYILNKSNSLTYEKLELKKYCKHCNKVTIHKETR